MFPLQAPGNHKFLLMFGNQCNKVKRLESDSERKMVPIDLGLYPTTSETPEESKLTSFPLYFQQTALYVGVSLA